MVAALDRKMKNVTDRHDSGSANIPIKRNKNVLVYTEVECELDPTKQNRK